MRRLVFLLAALSWPASASQVHPGGITSIEAFSGDLCDPNQTIRKSGWSGQRWACADWPSGSGGEANTSSSSGGGLAVTKTKVGVDLPFASFSATDFDLANDLFTVDASICRDSELSAAVATLQPLDADLTDLADGTLSGSKVGAGVPEASIDAAIARDSEVAAAYQPLDADLTDLADGSLTGSKVGPGVAWGNLTGVPAGFADGVDDTGGGGSGGPTYLRVAADVSNSTVNFADVTGLTMAVTSGTTYKIACFLTYTTAVSTTAVQVALNGPAATVDYGVEVSTTATARHNSAQAAYDTVVNPATGGAATRLPLTIHGTVVPSANGTLAVRVRSEIASSAVTIKRGSWCLVGA